MASSPPRGRLSDLQWSVLQAFFEREKGFFLTGGAALVGFHLGHRHTDDLDLFTLDDDAFARGRFVLGDIAVHLGAQLEVTQEAPGFRRSVLSTDQESVIVDLVRERAAQAMSEKTEHAGVRVDPPEEILINKLNAIVGRSEERDLVDLMCLERAGYPIEAALPAALAKDGGCTPATLAWLLSEVVIPEDGVLPGGVSPAELRGFVDSLIRRLRRLAHPPPVS